MMQSVNIYSYPVSAIFAAKSETSGIPLMHSGKKSCISRTRNPKNRFLVPAFSFNRLPYRKN